MKIEKLSIKELHSKLKEKELSATEVCKYFLEKIEKEDKKIGAFLTISQKLALLQAKKIDEKLSRNEKISILSGIPCAIKDNILVENLKCTAGSKILENYIAPYDATVVKKLKKEGVIILGKTNLDEFAMGSSTEYSAFFPTKNPLDLKRVPGGSSGGSAAAVAAGFCLFSLGSDTGGSIRQPAAFCGIAGLKPTYGAVSRFGLIAFASSLDQIGPLAKSAEDLKIIFNFIKGKDKLDSTTVKFREKKYKLEIKKLKLGLPKEYFVEGIDSKLKEEIEKALKKIENLGAKIEEISLPHTKYALACYYIIAPSEASSNLARYDGIKYARKNVKVKNLFDFYCKVRIQNFGPEVKRRIMLGTFALSSGYYEAYYQRAQKVRTKIWQDFEKAFEKVNAILTPTTPTLPFKFGEKTKDPLSMYLSDIFTVPVNLAGLPAISFPIGKIEHLPVSLQIIGPHFSENFLLDIAQIFENECK